MDQRSFLLTLLTFALLLVGCAEDELHIDAPTISGVEQAYSIIENGTITLTPTIEGDNYVACSWLIDDEEVATTLEYTFEGKEVGDYTLTFRATNSGGTTESIIKITVYSASNTMSIDAYTIAEIKLPAFVEEGGEVKIEVIESESDIYRLTKNEEGTPLFVAAEAGIYIVRVSSNVMAEDYVITVAERSEEISAYTAKVFDYLPAPGQFVNKMPEYEEGDTHEDMIAKVEEAIVGSEASLITLGGWGGYVTLGFDHTIVNVAGKLDFRINGNSFLGNAEPGIVMVAYDKNYNGKPDEDEWYEIAGSGSFTAEKEEWYENALAVGGDLNTYRDYEMTFYRPDVEDSNALDQYIRWTNNKGEEGYKVKNTYHRQSYYPLWVKDDKITFSGIRLANNGWDRKGDGTYYVLEYYSYGYVDNYPNNDDRNAIDIDWAIDKEGNKANLPGIDFVKVINGIDKENGDIGEASTEVSKGEDLHAIGIDIDTIIKQ